MGIKKMPGEGAGQDWPGLWPHLDTPTLTDEGEKIKLALIHLKNIRQFARHIQDKAIRYSAPHVVSGLTEIILRLDTAIDEITGEAFNDESQGILI